MKRNLFAAAAVLMALRPRTRQYRRRVGQRESSQSARAEGGDRRSGDHGTL